MVVPILMPFSTKPNRLLDVKDREYHLNMARWCVYSGVNQQYYEHMNRIATNKNFYSPNRQWNLEEDIEGFLKDVSGQTNTRIKAEINMIQIMGNEYVGSANNMSITARAKSFNTMAKTRKDMKLAEMMYWTDVANSSTDKHKEFLKETMPIGETQKETQEIFENIYVDNYVKAINGLLKYTENANNFNGKKKQIAENLVLSGMGVMHPEPYNMDYRFRIVPTERFVFDRSAKLYDLSDANFMGEWDKMMPTEIYETATDLTDQDRRSIEDFVTSNASVYTFDGRVYTYKMYWRDVIKDQYGYVRDLDGNIYFARVNYVDEYGNKPRYTDDDIVDVSELTPYQKTIIKKKSGKAKKMVYADQWRYCKFIPAETINAGMVYQGIGDIVLEYGIMPFGEQNVYASDNMETPYKVNQYIYIDGNVYSPVDIAINPQRMINRIMSAVENILNNSRGAGTAYDPDMVEDEAEFLINMDQSKPVAIRTKGVGINNVIARYDNTIGQGANALANFANLFKRSIEDITGVNPAMKGQQQSSEQLVGVTQLMLKRGSVTQERFFDALEDIFRQCYQNMATSGKRFFIQNRRELVMHVGSDEGAMTLELSPDMNNEDHLVTITRSLSPEDERLKVDQMLVAYMQMGLLSDIYVANLIGRATEEDMYSAIRQFAKEKLQMQKMASKQQQQQLQQQAQMQQQAMAQQQKQSEDDKLQEAVEKEKDRQSGIHKQIIKTTGDLDKTRILANRQNV